MFMKISGWAFPKVEKAWSHGIRRVFLSEGDGNEWQVPIGHGSGGKGQSSLKFSKIIPSGDF